MALFGENVKVLRERAGLTQDALATKLKLKKPTPISLMEGPRKHLIPKAKRIERLAAALNAEPWELLKDVETEYDRLRRTSPVTGGKDDRTLAKGGSDVPASAHARIQQLEQQVRDSNRRRATFVRAMQDVTRRLSDALAKEARLSVHREDARTGSDEPRPRRGPNDSRR